MLADLSDQVAMLRKKLEREAKAREQAEELLESKALELYNVNKSLTDSIQKAKNNASRLNAIMNSITDCVVATDEDLNVLDINNAAEKFLSDSRIRLMKQSLLQFVSEPQKENYFELSRHAITNGISTNEEFLFCLANGNETPTEVKISVFEHDEEFFLLHVVRDVSRKKEREQEHKHLQDELAQAAKWEAVGQLAGGIAHEINTPSQYIGDNLHFLNECMTQVFAILEKTLELKKVCSKNDAYSAINQSIDNMIEDYDLAYLIEEMPEALKQSSNGIAQISRIVLAMKNFSHPGAKEKEPFNINSAIETTLTVSRNEWKSVANVETDFDEHLEAVSCIPGAINQVFLNLIVNAAHAISEKSQEMGTITIRTCQIDDGVDIFIADTGNGIPEQHRKSIFNPFFTTKEVGKGTGQGLSIAKDIVVKKHNGTISFETETGKGTTFHIHLPKK